MSFCSFSSQYIPDNKTTIDNTFITSIMPYAPSDYVKVYLYGLMLCRDANDVNNTIESASINLNMPKEDIMMAFEYWKEQELIVIMDTIPVQIKFLPVVEPKNIHPKISHLRV